MKLFYTLFGLLFIGYVLVIGSELTEKIYKASSANNSTKIAITPLVSNQTLDEVWTKPDDTELIYNPDYKLIKYGQALIEHTSEYLGPKGSVAQISNGMNCQNCHLDAGTKPWGNNYFAVYSTYPKFRDRSGATESIAKRVNDCFERSLNGQSLDTNVKEMQAILSYIKWLGTNVKQGDKPNGSGIQELPYLTRAANPKNGKIIYEQKCASCHQTNGEGVLNKEQTAYQFPPLWGKNSYNQGAGLFRLSRFAGYVKSNMPLGVNYKNTVLTDEEAWDVAAFVNSQPRPSKDLSEDWPKIAAKPIDHPFGPYADKFNEVQHKFGPFGPIKTAKAKAL